MQNATSLAVAADHPVARRIAAQAHRDLLVLERVINDEDRQAVHRNSRWKTSGARVPFFGSTAGEGGWRVAIVDAVDELNAAGANALLKVLEEPPARALAAAREPRARPADLPTIRSRCRRLLLRPLSVADVAFAIAAATGRGADDAEVQDAGGRRRRQRGARARLP